MAEEDGETWYAFYTVMKLHWKPHEFVFLPPHEKYVMIAFIEERLKQENKQRKEIDSKLHTSRRGGH